MNWDAYANVLLYQHIVRVDYDTAATTLLCVLLSCTHMCVIYAEKIVSSIFESLGHQTSVSEVESNKNLPSIHDFSYLQNFPTADHISATLVLSMLEFLQAELSFFARQ